MDLIRFVRHIINAPREVTRLRGTIAALNRELAEERRERSRERYDARHDPLTGLPNRRYLAERAGLFLGTPRPAVAMLDLNGFKSINDLLGHAAGDAVLVTVAERLRGQLGSRWLVARLSGDEFAAVREGPADEPAVVAEATALAQALAAPMRVDRYELRVSCSIGLVIATAAVELSQLLRRADAALYRSKALGGQPVMWQPRRDGDSGPGADARPVLRTRDLRRARFGGLSVLAAADHDNGGGQAAVGRAKPVSMAGAP